MDPSTARPAEPTTTRLAVAEGDAAAGMQAAAAASPDCLPIASAAPRGLAADQEEAMGQLRSGAYVGKNAVVAASRGAEGMRVSAPRQQSHPWSVGMSSTYTL